VKRYLPYAIVFAAWALLFAYAHPGLLGVDSIYQLVQARSGVYGNWHPPMMAVIWSVLDRIVAGPLLMFVLQTALFAAGLYLLARRYWAPLPASIVAASMLVFPPVFVVLAGIFKDALMAGLLLCGAAGLLAASRPARVAGWLAIALAATMRHNAAIVIVPLVAMIAPLSSKGWKRHAVGAAIGIAISAGALLVDRALTKNDEHPFANMLALADVAGTIAHAPDLPDGDVRELLAGTPLRATTDLQPRMRALRLERNGWESLALGDDRMFDLAEDDAHADAIVAAWKRAIAAYPGAYLAHRVRVFDMAMAWSGPKPDFSSVGNENPEHLATVGQVRSYDGFQLAVGRGLRVIHRWPIFSPILYLVLAIGLLVVQWRDPLLRGLLGGAVAYALSLTVLSPGGHDYRYVHWLAVVAIFAAIVHVSAAVRSRASPATPPDPAA
jgi:hypothetical protein